MKKYIPIILSLTFVGCTTGSKTKTNVNYYSNVSYIPEPEVRYVEVPVQVPVEVVKEKRIVEYRPVRHLAMADLGAEIGRKMLRKMKAAYNEN
jgi:hypothetical protein